MSESILTLKNITKIYDNGILANKNIDLDVKKGEIHAIVGENGAGKSTLMKVIFGIEQPNTGEIYINGQKTVIQDVNHAISMGIGMVHQHFMLISSFTVTQNVMLGMEPTKGVSIDHNKSDAKVKEFAQKYNFQVKPDDIVEHISVGMKQKVEIMKALIRGAKLLILDEPTAVLTPQETEELFQQLKLLKAEGHTILFISHKLKEVKAICDRVTVIRKGESKGVFHTKDVSIKEISNLMVGREITLSYDKKPTKSLSNMLKVQNLSLTKDGRQGLRDVSFTIKKGMIFGVAGVEGNGQNELVKILSGQTSGYQGTVELNGKEIKNYNIAKLRNGGLSYIPEDRMHMGIAPEGNIRDNSISNQYKSKRLRKGFLQNNKKIKRIADEIIEDFQVLCENSNQKIGHLSGGNIQKVVVGRECIVNPAFLIAEQPTRGVDLGAIEIIHKKLIDLRDQGTGILLISADLTEVMKISDHLIVLHNGEITAFITDPSGLTEEELGEYMLGVKKQTKEEIGGAYRE